ncbi:hypothetical protein REPUB_Repub12eG0006100 [Reevesia pubescens]
MKAFLLIYFFLSSFLVSPFPILARELHNVKHNGGKTDFPVTSGTSNRAVQRPSTCHKEGKFFVCQIPTPSPRSREQLSQSYVNVGCPVRYIPYDSPCPCHSVRNL